MKIVRGARPRTAATSAALPCAIVRRRAATNQQVIGHNSCNRAQINSTIVAHRSNNVRPSPRDTCAQDFVIGRRSLAQWVAHTSSNWSASMREGGGQLLAAMHIQVFLGVTFLETRAWLRPVSRGNRHFTVGGGRLRQSSPRPAGRLLRQPALEGLTRSAWTDSTRQVGRNKFRRGGGGGGGGGVSIGYPRMSACGESSTTMHRLLHASGSHPIPPPNDPKLVALSSSSLGLSIDTSLETGVIEFEEHEVVAVFVYLRDCGPVVLLFFSSFGFELVVASVEFAVKLLGQ
ncbi:hypothetical protein F511_15269 [Dorcoceras hygrometricum]|uniref:Uncharacterized protein n=1 Tax=Dorcoceras hygrometricum TaxID=472368 RepID=A0A2Z7BXQ3_9LAMI|nr:hypothetical protein F511_15269 [Dorcoceras hygrometricum]